MRARIAYSVLTLFALTQLAAAQGPSGGTGVVASIPSSVVRAAEQKPPVAQLGIIGMIIGATKPDANVNSKRTTRRRDNSSAPPK
jgi:hypothetical protein